MQKWVLVLLILVLLILFLLFIISKIGRILFEIEAKKIAKKILNNADIKDIKTIKEEDITGLPCTVQNWLRNSKVIGKQQIISVRLKQKGRMRIKKGGPWMPTQAVQYFNVHSPEFVWIAKVKMAPFVQLSGLDTYRDGKGKMDIKLLSAIPVVNSEGPEINSGTMMRFLAEMMWFPSAALSPYIKWEEVGENTAKATIEYKGNIVSGCFYFNERGDVLRFLGKRYKDVNGKYILSDWGGENLEFKEFAGIRIPNKSVIIWYEENCNFNWFECEIEDIEFNKPSVYK
ncbi:MULTISPECIES: DUF6544 family protein [Niallia]|uniref:DUF6544 family protein n=1 Tax=Niallia TaxID=2837506 RepID=UPI0030FCEE28